MQETTPRTPSKVVSLADWRAERTKHELPLFAQPSDANAVPELTPTRVLRPRDISHRERMLSFLRSTS
jgi:hypothetical protein